MSPSLTEENKSNSLDKQNHSHPLPQGTSFFDQCVDTYLSLAGTFGSLPSFSDMQMCLGSEFFDSFSNDIGLLRAALYRQKQHFFRIKAIDYDTIKELFFDQIMLYLDLWLPHKKAYRTIILSALHAPQVLRSLLDHHTSLLRHSLLSLKAPLPPWKRPIVIYTSLGILALTLRTWFEDESLDQGVTMAKLSELLDTCEGLL